MCVDNYVVCRFDPRVNKPENIYFESVFNHLNDMKPQSVMLLSLVAICVSVFYERFCLNVFACPFCVLKGSNAFIINNQGLISFTVIVYHRDWSSWPNARWIWILNSLFKDIKPSRKNRRRKLLKQSMPYACQICQFTYWKCVANS